ncbi:MAG: hypothetical protein E7392_01050 [Ruminococcaceae bacterium]|nr:hypothetical protein [Oscillospiraceae bacterium]
MKRKNLYQILGEIKDDHILNGLVELKYQKGTNKEIDSADYSTLSTQISSEFERYLSDLIDDESVFFQTMLLEEINNKTIFSGHLKTFYGYAFQQFTAYLNLSVITSNDYFLQHEVIDKNRENKDKIELLKILNGISIRIAREVLCLLENGFPHGALSRWRSIYEIWIITEYIDLHDNDMAIKFINHKKSDSNYSWAKSSKCPPNSKGKYTFELLQKYIHEELDKDSSIKSTTGLLYSDWIDEYRLSNKILHIDSTGIFGSWDTQHKDKNNQLYTNASDVGFEKPASNTLGCLYNINRIALSSLKAKNDPLALHLLRNMCDKAIESFEKANSQS